jgi:hypothetical protein
MSQPQSINQHARPTSASRAEPVILPGTYHQAAAYVALLARWGDVDEAETVGEGKTRPYQKVWRELGGKLAIE